MITFADINWLPLISDWFAFVVYPALANGGYQIYRRKTPLKVTVQRKTSERAVRVYINRRGFFSWPEEALNILRNTRGGREEGIYFYRWVCMGTIKVDDPEADEKIIETVITAKNAANRWTRDDELRRLHKVGTRALKA